MTFDIILDAVSKRVETVIREKISIETNKVNNDLGRNRLFVFAEFDAVQLQPTQAQIDGVVNNYKKRVGEIIARELSNQVLKKLFPNDFTE